MNNIATKKTTSRLAAVQAIYKFEINSRDKTIGEIINSILEFYNDTETLNEYDAKLDSPIKLNINFFKELVEYTINNITQIDEIIEQYLIEGWSLQKIDVSSLALLRVGICELKYFPETPLKVVINEFTNIASDLLKSQDIGFVNSILDNIGKEIRQ